MATETKDNSPLQVEVLVRMVNGQKVALKLEKTDTVGVVRNLLVSEHGFMEDGLKLVCQGKMPGDEATLESLGFNGDGKTTFVVVGKRKDTITGTAAAKRRKIEDEEQKPEKKTDEAQPKTPTPDTTPPPRVANTDGPSPPGAPVQERTRAPLDRLLGQILQGGGVVLDDGDEEGLTEGDLLALEAEGQSNDYSEDEEGELGDLQQVLDGLSSIRERLANDPSQLQTILSELQTTHPSLYQEIESDPSTFLAFINDDASSIPLLDTSDYPINASSAESLTPADQEAINRLAQLAQVPVETARHAYLVMGKNEEAAANMLFD